MLLVAKTDKGRLTRMVSDAFPDKDFIRRVYELAGNFVEVAVGSGYNMVYEFNFALFVKTYGLPPLPHAECHAASHPVGLFRVYRGGHDAVAHHDHCKEGGVLRHQS